MIARGLLVLTLLLIGVPAHAQQLTADLTRHQVDITTGFTGADVTVFGTIEGGGDLIVVARGPSREIVVRQKTRESAIWLNTSSFVFRSVPAYYAALSSGPLDTLLPLTARKLDGVGIDAVNLSPDEKGAEPDLPAFRTALLDNLHDAGLYREDSAAIKFLSAHLFRATLSFPASVPTGTYPITIFLVRNNEIVSSETLQLVIAESGFEATTDMFSANHPTLYGLVAVAIAAVAGWFGTLLFRNP